MLKYREIERVCASIAQLIYIHDYVLEIGSDVLTAGIAQLKNIGVANLFTT